MSDQPAHGRNRLPESDAGKHRGYRLRILRAEQEAVWSSRPTTNVSGRATTSIRPSSLRTGQRLGRRPRGHVVVPCHVGPGLSMSQAASRAHHASRADA